MNFLKREDRVKHFFWGAFISLFVSIAITIVYGFMWGVCVGFFTGVLAGAGKEVYDFFDYGGADIYDFWATVLGSLFGIVLFLPIYYFM